MSDHFSENFKQYIDNNFDTNSGPNSPQFQHGGNTGNPQQTTDTFYLQGSQNNLEKTVGLEALQKQIEADKSQYVTKNEFQNMFEQMTTKFQESLLLQNQQLTNLIISQNQQKTNPAASIQMKTEKKQKPVNSKQYPQQSFQSLPKQHSSSNSELSFESQNSQSTFAQETPQVHSVYDRMRLKKVRDIKVCDLPDYQPGEDLHFYFQKFENNFLGVDDDMKIHFCISKFSQVAPVCLTAMACRKYNSFKYFKNKILSKHGKKSENLLVEFQQLNKDEGETYADFLDRCYMKLQQPSIKMNKGFMLHELYDKLPKYYQKAIKKTDIRSFTWLRHKVMELESSYVHQQLDKLEQVFEQQTFQPYAKQQNPQNYQYAPQQQYQQNNRNFHHKKGNTGHLGKSTQQSQPQVPKQATQNTQPEQQYYVRQPTSFSEQQNINKQSQNQQAFFVGYNQPQGLAFQQPVQYQNQQNTTSVLPISKSKIHSQDIDPKQLVQSLPITSQNSVPIFMAGPVTRSQSKGINKTTKRKDNIETEEEPDSQDTTRIQVENEQSPRFFQYQDYKKQTVQDVKKQVLKAQLSEDVNIILDGGIFSDSQGNIQLTRALKSIKYPLSLFEIQELMKSAKNGTVPIYYNEQNQIVQNLEDNLQNIFLQVNQENFFQKEAHRVQSQGTHLYINTEINGKLVPALIDTGAVRTILSTDLVEYCKLENQIESYVNQPALQGIIGGASIGQYVKNLQLKFGSNNNSISLCLAAPVIQTTNFQILIGQDILQHHFTKCIININQMLLAVSYKSISITIPLFSIKPNNIAIFLTQEIDYNIQKTFPSLQQYIKYFDLAIIDLPLQTKDALFNSRVPYKTLSSFELQNFGIVLNYIMKKDCVLLFWISGKQIGVLLDLLNKWGFTFFSILLVWVKLYQNGNLKQGLGFWTRSNVEFLVMAKRGTCSHFKSSFKNVSQYMGTLYQPPETQKHSSKPLQFYSALSQIFNLQNMKNIELFARQSISDIQSQNFHLYGDEIPNMLQIPQKDLSMPIFIQNVVDSDSKFELFYSKLDISQEFKNDLKIKQIFANNYDVFDFEGKPGLATNQVLKLRFKPSIQPPKLRIIRYDSERLQFLKDTLLEWQNNNYIYDGEIEFVFAPVIVPKKNSEKKFRMCYNFQPLNELLLDEPFEQNDVEEIISHAKNAKFLCSIDLTAAHQQIPIEQNSQQFVGLWTPWGTKISKVGQFGLLTIAKVFSKGVHKSIGHLQPHVFAYADDIVIYGQTLEECSYYLNTVLQCLKKDGYIVSSKKGHFFKQQLDILGQRVGNGVVSVPPERVEAIKNLNIPTSKKEMQKFIGVLSYLRKFCPNEAVMLAPLYESLKQKDFQLSELQKIVCEQLKQLIMSNHVLHLPDFNKTFYITISYSTLGVGACLMQKRDKVLVPIYYRSKSVPVENCKPQYLMKLESLVQAIKDWRKILFGKRIIIITDNKILPQALNFNGENTQINKLQSKLFDLQFEIQIKPSSFKSLKFCQILCEDSEKQSFELIDNLLTEYEKLNLQAQIQRTTKKDLVYNIQYDQYDFVCFFDGACTTKIKSTSLGAYAWVIYNNGKQDIFSEANQVCSQDRITNNVSENTALLKLLIFLEKQKWFNKKIQIIGDSELTIRQLQGMYRINNNAIRVLQRQIKVIFKKFKSITITHLPRQFNKRADFLAQSKLKDIVKTSSENNEQIQIFSVTLPDQIDNIICTLCGSANSEELMYLCDECGCGEHEKCLGETIRDSSFHFCKNCDSQIFENIIGKEDITEDKLFLEFLQDINVPISESKLLEYQRLAQFYCFKDGLFFKTPTGPKRVPPKGERQLIISHLHVQLGHTSIFNTIRAVKQNYFWPNLTKDIQDFIKKCALCQARKQPYLPMSGVYPTLKGISVWQVVSVDLIEIRSIDGSQYKYVLSAICNFSKAPELVCLPNKTSQSVADAFRDQIILRYGAPLIVRSDQGTEFQGEFQNLLQKSHCQHVTSSPHFPQSNGLVERLNQTIKSKLQTLYNSDEFYDKWENLIQTVAFGIRITISRSTGFSPYQLMYGRDCIIPGTQEIIPYDNCTDPTLYQTSVYVEQLIKTLHFNESLVRENLKKMDLEIIKTIEEREFRTITNLEFGQPIFVKVADQSTKLSVNVEGICYFVRYVDIQRRDVIVYFNPKSQRFLKANISNVKLCSV